MLIKKVKIKDDGYLVNENSFVVKNPLLRSYKQVLEFIDEGGVVEPEFTPAELEAKEAAEAYEADMKQSELDIKAGSMVLVHFRRLTRGATGEEVTANLALFSDLLPLLHAGSELALTMIEAFTDEQLEPTSLTPEDRDFLVNVYNNTRAGV